MNLGQCEKEQEVLEAARTGRWDDDLRRHAVTCPVCADVALVTSFLQQENEWARDEALLPEASCIWWKAQILAKREAAERALRPIALVEKFAYACGALALSALAVWGWPSILSWVDRLGEFGRWHDSWLHDLLLGLWNQPSAVLILGASALMLFMAFAAYLVWSEE